MRSILLCLLLVMGAGVVAGCAQQPAKKVTSEAGNNLHQAVLSDSKAIFSALIDGADETRLSRRPVACPNGRDRASAGITARDLAKICGLNDALEAFAVYDRDVLSWQAVHRANEPADYQAFLAAEPDNIFRNKAQQALAGRLQQIRAELQASSQCALQEPDWFWISGECPQGVAQGEGIARNTEGNEFRGRVTDGRLVQGKWLENNRIVYDGGFAEGLRHGDGICLHEGAYEPCRYYRNDRVDDVFVQRRLMARHLEYLRTVRGSGGQPGSWSQALSAEEKNMLRNLDRSSGYNSADTGE
ncbi:hypothetical protein [Thalassolituus hydrocarboniclasticus]|uniref:Lipoprotein n=1 Tax=Thalassolituus hydrocarboniclasticus TaxID=2742796 RepID=A0ABY6A775_9GAMM|nr:hypothetical protein [Thalassolituus hydrocarboniclasticus]UXD86435.1 hypothetical protein HUF19_02800 [Thalassolituus hydrocarboniclasticus]